MTTLFSWALRDKYGRVSETGPYGNDFLARNPHTPEKEGKTKKESKTIQLHLACGRTELDITSYRIETHRRLLTLHCHGVT